MKVRIVQLLCPARHCLLTMAYEISEGEANLQVSGELMTHFYQLLRLGIVNPRCGLCGSIVLLAEDAPTPFSTIEEARPYLFELAQQQAAAREFFRQSKN